MSLTVRTNWQRYTAGLRNDDRAFELNFGDHGTCSLFTLIAIFHEAGSQGDALGHFRLRVRSIVAEVDEHSGFIGPPLDRSVPGDFEVTSQNENSNSAATPLSLLGATLLLAKAGLGRQSSSIC